jgi:hypothetical protein
VAPRRILCPRASQTCRSIWHTTGSGTPIWIEWRSHCPALRPYSGQTGWLPPTDLHGLCTFGITCRAMLQELCDFDPARVLSHPARFSAPVFPGETITVDLWQDGNVISIEARVVDRGVTVIRNGRPCCAARTISLDTSQTWALGHCILDTSGTSHAR